MFTKKQTFLTLSLFLTRAEQSQQRAQTMAAAMRFFVAATAYIW